jgi:hypothetical protein
VQRVVADDDGLRRRDSNGLLAESKRFGDRQSGIVTEHGEVKSRKLVRIAGKIRSPQGDTVFPGGRHDQRVLERAFSGHGLPAPTIKLVVDAVHSAERIAIRNLQLGGATGQLAPGFNRWVGRHRVKQSDIQFGRGAVDGELETGNRGRAGAGFASGDDLVHAIVADCELAGHGLAR